MAQRLGRCAVILVLTALGFLQFPGHTFLQSDTQIYMPMLEQFWDPTILARDLLATRPHVSFTIYDEMALLLRRLTGWEFETVLVLQQLVFRALGILGIFLVATSLQLSGRPALLVTSIFTLGATIGGPAVLTFEYEPVPRGYAVMLLMAAIGFAAHGRMFASEVFASIAFLYHPPTVVPFWAVYFLLTLWPSNPATMSRRIRGLVPIFTAVLLMFYLSHHQKGIVEGQTLFARIDPDLEKLQRMRASYNWASVWWRNWMWHYLFLWVAGLAALFRLRRSTSQELRFFGVGLPLAGLLSVAASYLLLEKLKWVVVPQFQPSRALLFTTAFAGLFAAAAAAKAKHWLESAVWFALAYAIPIQYRLLSPMTLRRIPLMLGLALLAAVAVRVQQRRWGIAVWGAALLAPFFLIPDWGKVINYPKLETPELQQLAEWGRASTPKDAVFLFPDAGQNLYPGIFRVRALRAVYTDWKAGGQVNFLKAFGEEWWSRWEKAMAPKFDPGNLDRYRDLGIDYLVVQRSHAIGGRAPAFENARFVAYRLP